MLLSSVRIPWPSIIWVDTGILYPFFMKDQTVDWSCWVDDLIHLARTRRVCTTKMVTTELKKVWSRWSLSESTKISRRYKQLFSLCLIDNIVGDEIPPLSATDMSLIRAAGSSTIVTSDRALFESTPGSAIMLKMEAVPYGSPKLNFIERSRRHA